VNTLERLPYGQIEIVDYRYIKHVRLIRNKTLKEFERFMGVDSTVISRLEKGQIKFSPLYQERFKLACKKLRVSNGTG
jgi:transcriptional regulator with XRE-family HTH domain